MRPPGLWLKASRLFRYENRVHMAAECRGTRSLLRSGVTATALATGLAVAGFVIGCGSRPEQSLDNQLKELGTTRQLTAKFAGTVTIDGQPPRAVIGRGLRILLYDPNNPPARARSPLNATVDPDDGHFEFTTYSAGDGVPQGTYVVLFVALEHSTTGANRRYHEPDALKNLYNDPDVNKNTQDFNVTLLGSGKTDYHFNLELAGREPAGSPGPNAITALR